MISDRDETTKSYFLGPPPPAPTLSCYSYYNTVCGARAMGSTKWILIKSNTWSVIYRVGGFYVHVLCFSATMNGESRRLILSSFPSSVGPYYSNYLCNTLYSFESDRVL